MWQIGLQQQFLSDNPHCQCLGFSHIPIKITATAQYLK